MTQSRKADVSAVILAAGFSSRMKTFKPLLPFGNKTMVEVVIDLFKANHISDIIVVSGHLSRQLQPHIENGDATPVFNPDFNSGMLSSIQKGVKSIRSGNTGFFLLPVDIPAIHPVTIKLMIEKFQETQNHIIMPYFGDASGHPPLIPCSFINDILELKDGATLRDLFRIHKEQIMPMKVDDRGVLVDADDKKGYEEVLQLFFNHQCKT